MENFDIAEMLFGEIVCVEPISFVKNRKVKPYADARSAGFYAMGKALRTGETVILLVPGEFLTSVHTALTECWFQKASVIVIAFFEKISEVKTQWMDRCVISTLTAGIDEADLIQHYLKENATPKGPVLLNIVGKTCIPEKKDYSAALFQISEKKVCTFHGMDKNTIPYHYKYGLISKYIGASIIKDCGILMCTTDCVLVDVNVFRTRYANKNMRIVVFDDGTLSEKSIDLWIQSNGWECRNTQSLSELRWLCEIDKQAVLIIKET